MLTWVDRARDHGVGGIFIAGGSSGWRQRLVSERCSGCHSGDC